MKKRVLISFILQRDKMIEISVPVYEEERYSSYGVYVYT